jgi:pimeloyl-ACP methyl ester carboxylesterase
MPTKRREFIRNTGALGIFTSLGALTLPSFTMSNNSEIEDFKNAQRKLLLKYDIHSSSKFIKLTEPDLRIHVLESGSGTPVVMLHGGKGTAAQFAPLMGALQKDFQLFVPDRPGCGLSDMFNYTEIPFRKHAVDVVKGILDGLGLSRADIIGNSMGGYWALVFALAYPDRVSKLVLIGEPAASGPQDPSNMHTPPYADPNPSIESTRGRYSAILVADINRVATEILAEDLAAARIPGANLAWNSMLDDVKREKKVLTYALRPELKNLQPQTLFIWGEKDRFGPAVLGKEMAALAPNARCEVVSDAGHLVWLDQPVICTSLTTEFLK